MDVEIGSNEMLKKARLDGLFKCKSWNAQKKILTCGNKKWRSNQHGGSSSSGSASSSSSSSSSINHNPTLSPTTVLTTPPPQVHVIANGGDAQANHLHLQLQLQIQLQQLLLLLLLVLLLLQLQLQLQPTFSLDHEDRQVDLSRRGCGVSLEGATPFHIVRDNRVAFIGHRHHPLHQPSWSRQVSAPRPTPTPNITPWPRPTNPGHLDAQCDILGWVCPTINLGSLSACKTNLET